MNKNDKYRLTGGLLIVVVAASIWLATSQESPPAAESLNRPGAYRSSKPSEHTSARVGGEDSSSRTQKTAREGKVLVSSSKSLGHEVLMSELTSAAKEVGLRLSSDQINTIYSAYRTAYEQRLQHEAVIANAIPISENETLIEIPEYRVVGEALRKKAEAEVVNAIGSFAANKLIAAMKDGAETINSNWGRHEQQLLVLYDSERDVYKITHKTLLEQSSGDINPPVRVSISSLKSANLVNYTLLKPIFPAPKS